MPISWPCAVFILLNSSDSLARATEVSFSLDSSRSRAGFWWLRAPEEEVSDIDGPPELFKFPVGGTEIVVEVLREVLKGVPG